MKYTASLCGLLVLLGAVSCKEKEKGASAPAEEKSVAGEVTEAVKEAVKETIKEAVAPAVEPSLSDEERAAKLGFAKYLPKDTELVMSVYNSRKAADQLKALKLYGLLSSEFGMDEIVPGDDGPILEDDFPIEEGEQADDGLDGGEGLEGLAEGEMMEEPSPWVLLGQEVTIAMGDTTAQQAGNMLTLNRRMSYFQAKMIGQAAQTYARTGKMEDFSAQLQQSMGEDLFKDFLKDPESGIGLIRKAEMPPIYIAFRAKEGELEQAAQLVNGGMGIFGMAGEMAAPVEIETGGGKFSGFKLMGSEIAKQMEEGREEMEENLDAQTVDGLIDAISKKNLLVVSGTVADYVVVMIGGSEESLKLASDIKDSIIAGEELEFCDPYADKQLLTLVYGGNEVWTEIMKEAAGLSTYALGMRDGISGGGGGLGDTRDLEAMLQIIADREKALLSLGSSDDLGMVAYVDEGLRIESFGGYDKGSVDWSAETSLAHLGDSGDNMLFLSIPGNAAYNEKLSSYLEAIVETAYAATVKFSELEIDAPELAEMKQFMKLFDGQFRADAVGLYGALDSLSQGLGHEKAIVVDLKGSMPAIPGLPQKFVDEAKAPRITMVSPVTDRSKIKDAWKEMDTRSTSLLAKISEMTGEKIPMQKPVSSEKDGMTTWFMSFPFFQDDFLPSVTVSDEWFAMSTSKTQSLDLLGKAAAGGAKGSGVEFYMNFSALTDYATQMLDVVDRNSAEIFTEEFQLENFKSEKEEMQKVIEACSEFDSLNWTVKKENGRMRGSVHFRTK